MRISAFIIAFTLLLNFNNIYSQNNIRVGGELGLQKPVGDFGEISNTGFGFTGIFQYSMNPNLIVGGTLGYHYWGAKGIGDLLSGSFSTIPVMVLMNYKFNSPNLIPFIGCELGMNFYSTNSDILINQIKYTQTKNYNDFGFNILAGIEQKINENMIWRINAKYNLMFDFDSYSQEFIGINAGVMYQPQ